MNMSLSESLFQRAKVAHMASRYADVVRSVKQMIENDIMLPVEVIDMMQIAYKALVVKCQNQIRNIEKCSEDSREMARLKNSKIFDLKQKIRNLCVSVFTIISDKVLPFQQSTDIRMVCYKINGDFNNLLSRNVGYMGWSLRINETIEAYNTALKLSKRISDFNKDKEMLILNYSSYKWHILKDKTGAINIAQEGLSDALDLKKRINSKQLSLLNIFIKELQRKLTIWGNFQMSKDMRYLTSGESGLKRANVDQQNTTP
ncbi:14-3-3 protein zeta-like [Teleopsis dalmanni]|uniref:14-3-3 protein zeta-like n=1 Tax=Teleopsis dalmanni TaxID=139649 RepID=UPI000D32A9BB|nr:14-3-3 protein zeta-like [Teleopsis dalmanni]XP_037960057.1 14-3-3 protein zeta-like [Teleopsis dalmanni]XP_037960058.1 14-3-3 protein zeta-like [Teleopsis dalmanni]XP_037960059.1 14-3-3 protein zeta-like [Teleopsis dalmanni]